MKKILIISYLFAPNNDIGAIRPTKIASFLAKKGYIVDVISYGWKGNDSLPEPDAIRNHYMMNAVPVVLDGRQTPKSSTVAKRDGAFVRSCKNHYRTYLLFKRSQAFKQFCLTLYKEKLIDQQYDVLLTSYGPPVSLQCGLEIKKISPKICWISDFRDPVVTEDSPLLYKGYYRYIQNEACKKADRIVAVSKGYLKRICGKTLAAKCHMIPNGYDKADEMIAKTCVLSSEVLHITYVGALYEGKRKITPLFCALRELANEKQIDMDRICFDYAGSSEAFLRQQAAECGLGSLIRCHGVLSRQECLKLQFSSHLLVLSTWNNRGEEGVFPGKFLEYMLIGRPIISLTDGNLPDSEVSAVIREGRLGVAYESARDHEDAALLKDYIRSCYSEWERTGKIAFAPVKEVLDRYDYKNISDRIEGLIIGT